MICVTLTLTSPRQPRTYTGTVTVEGCVNMDNASYNFDPKGNGTIQLSISLVSVHCCTQLYCSSLYSFLLLPSVAGTPTGVIANICGKLWSRRKTCDHSQTATFTITGNLFYYNMSIKDELIFCR